MAWWCRFLLLSVAFLSAAASVSYAEEKKDTPAAEPVSSQGTGASPVANKTTVDPGQEPKEKKPLTEAPELEIRVTATRSKNTELESNRSLTVIPQKRLAERNRISILDALDDQPGVWTYKRTATESDPVIRGFSGANLLALVDGDTLTTLWGEGGEGMDDLYGKIESESIERIEIVRGPASLAYGSNCLGGVLNFVTRKCPLDYTAPDKFEYGGRYKFSTGSASEEYRGRAEQWFATPDLRFFMGGSAGDAGNTRAGEGFTEKGTGGEYRDWDANAEIKLADEHFVELTYQHMDRDDLGRYHWPGQTNSNDREAGHFQYAYRTEGWLRELALKSYYQYKRDRRWFPVNAPTSVREGAQRWNTFQESLQTDLRFGSKDEHHVVAGLAFELDLGECPDNEQFVKLRPNGVKTKDAPDSKWCNYAAFAMDDWAVTDDLTLSYGVRLDYYTFYSHVDRLYVPPSPTWDPQADELSAYQTIPSWSAGFVYRLLASEPDLRLYGNYSRGFRLNPPVFGVTQTALGVRVPSPMLDPVTADSFEVGVRNASPYLRGSLCGYYSLFDHFQAQMPGTFNGQDWFDFNGNGTREASERIISVQDMGKAYMWGVEWQQDFRIDHLVKAPGRLWLGGGFAYNYGEDETDNPLRYTHPRWGFAKARWEQGDLWKNSLVKGLYFEYEARMAGRFDRIPRGLVQSDKGYLADPADSRSGLLRSYGLPGYTVHSFRGGFELSKYSSLSFGVDNLTDKRYRDAHSRADAAGRNFWLGAEFKW